MRRSKFLLVMIYRVNFRDTGAHRQKSYSGNADRIYIDKYTSVAPMSDVAKDGFVRP